MSCYDNIEVLAGDMRVLKKENTVFARDMYSNIWAEYINFYGISVDYHVHGYGLDTHDALYGEDPTALFEDAVSINIIPEFQSDALMLAKFGIETNADIILMIAVKDYQDKFGIGKEPKAGDVMELTESAWETSELPKYTDSISGETTGFDAKTLLCQYKDPDAVARIIMDGESLYGYKYVRHPHLFEITEVRYQDFSQSGMNFLQGHYVWKLHAKRFDYSFEPNISGEDPNQQVYDNDFFGTLSGDQNQKPYDDTVDEAGKAIWDYEEKGTDTSEYGYY